MPAEETMLKASIRIRDRIRSSFHSKDRAIRVFAFVLLCVISFIMIAPLFIMLSTALKDQQQVMAYPPQWIPNPMHWGDFVQSMEQAPFGQYFANTTYYSVVGTFGEVLSSVIVAYGFSRYKGKGREVLFYILLLTMMIPYPAIMIPQFIMFSKIGWINTYWPLIVPSFFSSAFTVFLMRQFFNGIPEELFEAARIDGCSEGRTFWQIALPLSMPATTAGVIFGFTYRWNDYLAPLVYLNNDSKYTLTIGLAGFIGKFSVVPWNYLMAATIIATLPMIVLFFFAQRYFVEGIVITGLK